MINKVANCGDIHIPKKLERHIEYREVFDKFYQKLKKQKPDRIVITGDVYNDYIDIEGEPLILVGEFLTSLSTISKVIIIKGNHDVRKKNRNRIDTIETAVTLLNNPNIIYYKKSGFYEDENVIWVVWDYLDKINPWKTFPTKRDPKFTYIDLYHNPVQNVMLCNGYGFKKKNVPDIKDLKGDISMLSDIHLHQSFMKGTKAYTSSIIQQNFGESPEGHGYTLWDIPNKSFEFIELKNNYALVNFELKSPDDYDNLQLSSKFVVDHNKFRVIWSDYAANVNRENELKIKRYLKDKYSVDDIRFQKFPYHTKIEDSKLISEVININDKQVQQDVIREYLQNNGYDEDFIKQIIEIDDIIYDRLEKSDVVNIVWDIDKVWFNNFKSYGDDNVLDLRTDGIIQINGINQFGKTTILDAICYALYGKTIATMGGKPKHGDSRYINNKRDLNYCDAGVILDINGEKFVIYRRTDRELNKHGEITSCPTIVDYYYGEEMLEENKMTGERGTKTQKMISDVLGDFKDFIRLALTNGDNLNQLLSMIRSEFIDSIIKDAGYEIFELKLEEFKDYKKEQNFEKIVLNPLSVEETINDNQGNINELVIEESEINNSIIDIDEKISKGLVVQEKLTLKVHKIDDDIMNLNVDKVTYDIEIDTKKVSENQSTITEYQEIIDGLPSEFDYRKFNDEIENKSKFEKDSHKKELEIVECERKMDENNFKIENVDTEIEMSKKKAINHKKNQIDELNNSINNDKNKISRITNEKERDIDKTITKLYNEIGKLDNELIQLKQNGIKFTNELKSYESARDGEKSNCPTCGQSMANCDENHLGKLIIEKQQELKVISDEAKPKLSKKKEIQSEIEVLNNSKKNINESIEIKLVLENIKNINEQIKKIEDQISNFDISEIKDEIDTITKNKEKAEKENKELQKNIDSNTILVKKLKNDIDELEKIIVEKNVTKKGIEKRKDYIIKMNNLSSTNNDLEKIIFKNESLIKEYNKNLKKIEENKDINNKIEQSKVIMKQLNDKKNEFINQKIVINNSITLHKKTISDLKERMKKYEEQLRREQLWGTYITIMSRTGLPTYLLKKNADLLNGELSTLLSNTNFNMFFDEDLNYKLEHNGLPGVINAIESSGMERTFAAIVLKTVLRTINFKSKPNFIFLDEVINRLVGDSVGKFVELLNTIKEKINKIVIIEHDNEIMADMIIDVTKDKNGVSSFEII
jgi:DNA repair exonuclease SbcCD ATPase subunit